jgi:hypothetical protein
MVFKFSCEIYGLRSGLPDSPEIKFHFNAPLTAMVQLSKNYSDGKEPADGSSAVCVSTAKGEIEDEICAAEIQVALSTSLDGRWANFKGISASRMPTVLAAVDRFFSPLITLTESTVSVLRWRAGLSEGPANPFHSRSEHLSQDGESWLEIGMARSATITFGIPFKVIEASPEFEDRIVGLVNERSEEPLGRQMFREAWNLRGAHPRSALAIGVAAAEVGLKKLIGTLVPQAEWLVDEIQTPSFGQMSRKYLPSLPVKGKFQGKKIAPPNSLIKKLERAVACRNKLVHAGQAPPHRDELEEMLRAVDDFLWICDVYVGQIWAAPYISHDTFAAWENE